MRRRDVLAGLVGSSASSALLARDVDGQRQPNRFESRWHEQPDMPWTGEDCWAQPMQDWAVVDGALTCLTPAPGRTVHVLTHGGSARHEPLYARLGVRWQHGKAGRAGLRIGIRGRFDDYRSAIMTGEGIDCALTSEGALMVGKVRSRQTVPPARRAAPVVLELAVEPLGGGRSRITLVARDPGGEALASVTTAVADEALRGNIAVLSDFEGSDGGNGPAASFTHLALWGERLDVDHARSFGPVYFAQYTVHEGTLRLSAQLAPMDLPGLELRLQVKAGAGWREIARGRPDPVARVAAFEVPDWSPDSDMPYRLTLRLAEHGQPWRLAYQGTIAAEPLGKPVVRTLTASCNWDYGFPDSDVVQHAAQHDADLVMFLGDQFYEENGGFGIQDHPAEAAVLDYLRKWVQFGWSYRDLFRHRPAIFLVDDHDVYQGNLWGAGGVATPAQGTPTARNDGGGYRMPAAWVNAVQRTQTSHMPPPFDPRPARQGISVYFCEWRYAGISFAIIEDRKYKSAPRTILPADARVANGYALNPDYDRAQAHTDAAQLLGEHQMRFLQQWSAKAGETDFRVLVSATPFACPHTLPAGERGDEITWKLKMPEPGEYVDGDAPTPDLDSNGWPQNRRDEVLRLLRGRVSIHLTGDQHLAQVLRYGVDDYGDSFPAFIAPPLCNYWPRRWWPPRAGHQPLPGQPDYTGNWQDALGNRMTVHAAANPAVSGIEPGLIHDLATGYGVVDFERATKRITVHCWPRHADPRSGPTGQFAGWPISFDDRERQAAAKAG